MEKRPKISKKYRKVALFTSSRGGGGNEKKTKNSKKGRKIVLLSLYYICTMFENPEGATAPLPPAADTHDCESNQYVSLIAITKNMN